MAIWVLPTLGALFAWGIAQGLVKKYIAEVPPARFCLYYALANAVVNLGYWSYHYLNHNTPELFTPDHRAFMLYGTLAYVLDGLAWIFYYQSIVSGPISIVGTLSAAYPSITVALAYVLLGEELGWAKFFAVVLVIVGCLGLAYSPPDPNAKKTNMRWIPLAGAALLIWGVNGLIIKHAYNQPGNSDANMAVFIAVGGMITLGVYGALFGLKGATAPGEWSRSFFPMATMALGGLLVSIALGMPGSKASIVTPLSGAYPVVTIGFAWAVLKERPSKLHWYCIGLIFVGMVLTTVGTS